MVDGMLPVKPGFQLMLSDVTLPKVLIVSGREPDSPLLSRASDLLMFRLVVTTFQGRRH